MRTFISFLTLSFLAVVPVHPFTLSNFEAPESVVVDPDDGSYYVSNVNGPLGEKDGNGYISKIGSNGNIVIQKFIGGVGDKQGRVLHAPKGLAIVGENVFVADIDTVKGFNRMTGVATVIVDLSKLEAKFLNDIAGDEEGNLYVSDTMANKIFKIEPSKDYQASLFKQSPDLGHPNGLLVNPKSKNLMVVAWESGSVLEIDRAGNIHVLKKGLSTLDGIDYDKQGNVYVSNFQKGEIYQIAFFGRGAVSVFLNGLTTPADIAYDRVKDEILIPSTQGNAVATVYHPKER